MLWTIEYLKIRDKSLKSLNFSKPREILKQIRKFISYYMERNTAS